MGILGEPDETPSQEARGWEWFEGRFFGLPLLLSCTYAIARSLTRAIEKQQSPFCVSTDGSECGGRWL